MPFYFRGLHRVHDYFTLLAYRALFAVNEAGVTLAHITVVAWQAGLFIHYAYTLFPAIRAALTVFFERPYAIADAALRTGLAAPEIELTKVQTLIGKPDQLPHV